MSKNRGLSTIVDGGLPWDEETLGQLLARQDLATLPDAKRGGRIHTGDDLRERREGVDFIAQLPDLQGSESEYILRSHKLSSFRGHSFAAHVDHLKSYESELQRLASTASKHALGGLVAAHSIFITSENEYLESAPSERDRFSTAYLILGRIGTGETLQDYLNEASTKNTLIKLGHTLLDYFESPTTPFLCDISRPKQYSHPTAALYDYGFDLDDSDEDRSLEVEEISEWARPLANITGGSLLLDRLHSLQAAYPPSDEDE